MDKGAVLEPTPCYLLKVKSMAEKQYQPILVRSLSAITDDPEELSLCLVRALGIFDDYARKKRVSSFCILLLILIQFSRAHCHLGWCD